MAAVGAERRALLHTSPEARLEQGHQLMPLNGLGSQGTGLLVLACFGWRVLQTRREVGGLAGLTPTP
jgi:hypothetical protein